MLSLKIAWRFLRSSFSQTLMIVLGIGVGVSVQVFIGSLITGLQVSLVDKTIGSQSQITVVSNVSGEYITDYSEIVAAMEAVDNIVTIAPILETGAVLIDGDATQNILVRGMDFDGSEAIYDFASKLIEGRLPSNADEVLMGMTLANEVGLQVGDTFDVYLPPTVGSGGAGEFYPVEIVGIYDFRVTTINDTWIVTTIATTRSLLDEAVGLSRIEAQVNQVFETDEDVATLQSELNNDRIVISDWKSQNAELLSGLNGQSASSIMIQVFVTLSVVLGIASVLAITVLQKSKQIGILKAMGITNGAASRIFLFQGMILGIFGAIVGVLFGLGLLWSFTTFALNEFGEPVVPLLIDPAFMALSAAIAFSSSSLASLLPARRSQSISIIEVIKNG